MRSSLNSAPLGALAAFGVTFVVLVASGVSNLKVDASVALGVALLALVYVLWANIHTKSAKPHLLLSDEENIDQTRRHPIIRVGAIVLASVGVGFVLYSMALLSSGDSKLGSSFPGLDGLLGTNPRKHHARHRAHHAQNVYHVAVNLWWWPLLLAIPLLILALYVWQNWKHTTLVITNKRFIVKREVAPYAPWMTPYFNQTPFEQIVDNDDDTSFIGNIGNWWGTLNVTRRLMESSDEQQPVDRYHLIPRYVEFADTLRAAREHFFREVEEARMAAQQAAREQEERLLQEQNLHFARIGDALERMSPPPVPTPVVHDDTQEIPPT